jgi:hypothetical protein
MVGGVALVVALLGYGNWRRSINHGIAVAAKWTFRIALDPKTCSVAETFLNEVAVLWFVFPLLDSIYDHKSISDPALHQAYWLSGVCFLGAVTLSHIARKDKKED